MFVSAFRYTLEQGLYLNTHQVHETHILNRPNTNWDQFNIGLLASRREILLMQGWKAIVQEKGWKTLEQRRKEHSLKPMFKVESEQPGLKMSNTLQRKQ